MASHFRIAHFFVASRTFNFALLTGFKNFLIVIMESAAWSACMPGLIRDDLGLKCWPMKLHIFSKKSKNGKNIFIKKCSNTHTAKLKKIQTICALQKSEFNRPLFWILFNFIKSF